MAILKSSLSDLEAKELLRRDKYFEKEEIFDFPDPGKRLNLEIYSYKPERTSFFLDIAREEFNLRKHSFQNRVYTRIILLRLDLGASGHRNPDGQEIRGPHLHVYREGYEDKWAYPLPNGFSDPNDAFTTLEQFMDYCNIIKKPIINRKLF